MLEKRRVESAEMTQKSKRPAPHSPHPSPPNLNLRAIDAYKVVYTVTPRDPSKAAELDAFLRTQDWGTDLVANREGDRIVSWTFELPWLRQRYAKSLLWLKHIVSVDSRLVPTTSEKRSVRRAQSEAERYRALANGITDSHAANK